MNASEVARRVWGTTVDSRGRTVARNRDRIGHYLAGTSYPEPDNLEALAKAVDVSVEALSIERAASTPAPRARNHRPPVGNVLSVTRVPNPPDQPRFARLQVDLILEEGVAQEFSKMLAQAEATHTLPIDQSYPNGTVINGGKDDSNGDTAAA